MNVHAVEYIELERASVEDLNRYALDGWRVVSAAWSGPGRGLLPGSWHESGWTVLMERLIGAKVER